MSESKVKAYDQLHVHIQRKTKKRLTDYAKAKGQSQGSITDAALREYLDDDQGQLFRVNYLVRFATISLSGWTLTIFQHFPSLPLRLFS